MNKITKYIALSFLGLTLTSSAITFLWDTPTNYTGGGAILASDIAGYNLTVRSGATSNVLWTVFSPTNGFTTNVVGYINASVNLQLTNGTKSAESTNVWYDNRVPSAPVNLRIQ